MRDTQNKIGYCQLSLGLLYENSAEHEGNEEVYPNTNKEISQAKNTNRYVVHEELLEAIVEDANIEKGYRYTIDLDLEKYFDTVNHSRLIQILSNTIKDGRVISLIHKYLNAGVIVKHKFEETVKGVPQGGPLSPLLSNIYLNEFDREMEKRGNRFVRYADDCAPRTLNISGAV